MRDDLRPSPPALAPEHGALRGAFRGLLTRRAWWLLPVGLGLLLAGALFAVHALGPVSVLVYPLL